MRYLIFIFLMFPFFVHADSVIIGGFSNHQYPAKTGGDFFIPGYARDGKIIAQPFHFKIEDVEYNERHPAIGVERNNTSFVLFINSYSEPSFSLTRKKLLFDNFGIRYGAATGYEQQAGNINGVIPIIQAGYFSKNYELTFGSVTTIIFKV